MEGKEYNNQLIIYHIYIERAKMYNNHAYRDSM